MRQYDLLNEAVERSSPAFGVPHPGTFVIDATRKVTVRPVDRQRTAQLNGYAPEPLVPILAWAATILETTFGVALVLGIATRWVALASAVLLAWFAIAMAVYTGVKAPLDYSVFSASAGALLVALIEDRHRKRGALPAAGP